MASPDEQAAGSTPVPAESDERSADARPELPAGDDGDGDDGGDGGDGDFGRGAGATPAPLVSGDPLLRPIVATPRLPAGADDGGDIDDVDDDAADPDDHEADSRDEIGSRDDERPVLPLGGPAAGPQPASSPPPEPTAPVSATSGSVTTSASVAPPAESTPPPPQPASGPPPAPTPPLTEPTPPSAPTQVPTPPVTSAGAPVSAPTAWSPAADAPPAAGHSAAGAQQFGPQQLGAQQLGAQQPGAQQPGMAPVGGYTGQQPAVAVPPAQPSGRRAAAPAAPRRGASAARASRSPRVNTQQGSGRRARVRRVTRVVRHVDPWSVFKIAAVFSFIAYGIALLSGYLLWQVAQATGTIDNLESGLMSTGWSTFELRGDEIFRNAWMGGLFVTVGVIGLAVLTATLFNLVTDLVGGVRFTVLEEEVIEKAPPAKQTQAAGRRK